MEYDAAMTKICKITRELEKVLEWVEGSHMARTSLYVSIYPEVTSYFGREHWVYKVLISVCAFLRQGLAMHIRVSLELSSCFFT